MTALANTGRTAAVPATAVALAFLAHYKDFTPTADLAILILTTSIAQ